MWGILCAASTSTSVYAEIYADIRVEVRPTLVFSLYANFCKVIEPLCTDNNFDNVIDDDSPPLQISQQKH